MPAFLAALPYIVSAVGSAIQLSQASKKKKEAAALPLPEQDYMQTKMLEDIERMRKSYETGLAMQPQQDVINLAGATAMKNVAKLTGGDVGAAISAMSNVNRGTGRTRNELFGQMSMQQLNLLNMYQDLQNRISQRKLGIQSWKKGQAMTEAAQMQQTGLQNLYGGLASMSGLLNTIDTNNISGGGTKSNATTNNVSDAFKQYVDNYYANQNNISNANNGVALPSEKGEGQMLFKTNYNG